VSMPGFRVTLLRTDRKPRKVILRADSEVIPEVGDCVTLDGLFWTVSKIRPTTIFFFQDIMSTRPARNDLAVQPSSVMPCNEGETPPRGSQ
jgi:hypothetical protein